MHYFVTCLPNRTATLLCIVSMTECTNHRLWDTETPSHKISHNEYYEKQGTTDETKHKPSMLQARIRHTRIRTVFFFDHILHFNAIMDDDQNIFLNGQNYHDNSRERKAIYYKLDKALVRYRAIKANVFQNN